LALLYQNIEHNPSQQTAAKEVCTLDAQVNLHKKLGDKCKSKFFLGADLHPLSLGHFVLMPHPSSVCCKQLTPNIGLLYSISLPQEV